MYISLIETLSRLRFQSRTVSKKIVRIETAINRDRDLISAANCGANGYKRCFLARANRRVLFRLRNEINGRIVRCYDMAQ